MKDSWLFYDYARRWLLLLLSFTLGAILGLAYYAKQVHPMEYTATASVAIEDPVSEAECPPAALIAIATGRRSTEEAAVEDVTSLVAEIAAYASTAVVIRDLQLQRNATDEAWWKAVVLGSAIGALLAIAAIYVWEDRAYRRTLPMEADRHPDLEAPVSL
ncbi:MAG: hypothetical protein QF659_05060 [Dehalococcoidia bacterium]|jgi:hypothetical protein|nr:hypothetical protein [Dehalococcoidia bacterium]